MPVGTAATVKGISAEQLRSTDAQMVLSNTFHLHLQPGESIVAAAGGLHRFMGWSGPMLTDSGGFQVFSLANLNAIKERGVTFQSPRDGSVVELTPERSMAIQEQLGADVAMAWVTCGGTLVSSLISCSSQCTSSSRFSSTLQPEIGHCFFFDA